VGAVNTIFFPIAVSSDFAMYFHLHFPEIKRKKIKTKNNKNDYLWL
jgi:hypothetical protein